MNAIDANVLIYAVDDAEPEKSAIALTLLRSLDRRNSVILWQTAVEFLACLRRWERAGRISRATTHEYLDQFVLSLPVSVPNVDVLRVALDLSLAHSLSHWDSLLLAACHEAGVTTLYSEDLTHGASYGSVRVINPFRRESPAAGAGA
jgi:predicted nucleic acid-binding protein